MWSFAQKPIPRRHDERPALSSRAAPAAVAGRTDVSPGTGFERIDASRDAGFERMSVQVPAAAALLHGAGTGSEGEQAEREADRIAGEVVRWPGPPVTQPPAAQDALEQRRLTRPLPPSRPAGFAAPAVVREVLAAAGHPLDAATRAFMEPRFGVDFASVRIHDDARAAASARSIGALAYTVGNRIVYGAAHTARDPLQRHLLAHELVHVIRQSGPASRQVLQRKGPPQSIGEMRTDDNLEAQRVEAVAIVTGYRELILDEAARHGIAAEAVAGAILWEALENPYSRTVLRRGPGKIRSISDTIAGKSEAEKAEAAGLIEPPDATGPVDQWNERSARLARPGWALRYAAAIMRRHANDYLQIARVDISKDPALLCTLFQVGDSEQRAQALADRLKTDPAAKPEPNDLMGQWVNDNLADIRALLAGPPPFGTSEQTYVVTPEIKATAPRERAVFARSGKDGTAVHLPLEIRRGGAPAWRTNNPGLLEYSTAQQLSPAAFDGVRLVHGRHRIAVYSSRERGRQALKAFLRKYQGERDLRLIVEIVPLLNATTRQAAAALAKALGLPEATLVKSLSDVQFDQLVAAIENLQGWTEGVTETRTD